jgi:integrase
MDGAEMSASYRTNLGYRLEWFVRQFGDLRLDEIGTVQFDRTKELLRKAGLAKSSINVQLSGLAGLLSYARARRVIKEYDSPGTYTLDPQHYEMYEENEIDELLIGAVDNVVRCAVALGADAGLRIGEIRALRREDVKGSKLVIMHSFYRRILGSPKSGRSRIVPMTPRLLTAVSTVLKSHASPWVLIREDGTHWTDYTANKLAPSKGWHALRHSLCSRLANTPGVTPTQVKELAGHASIKTTLRYCHTTEAQLEGAIAKLGQNVAKRSESTVG